MDELCHGRIADGRDALDLTGTQQDMDVPTSTNSSDNGMQLWVNISGTAWADNVI